MPRAAKPSSQQSELRRARKMAGAVLEHHFGRPARRMTHRAAGLSNYVFRAEHPDGEFVVRIAKKPDKLNAYIKEQWAIRRVHELGVPTAEVLEVGSDVIGMPYMIVRCVHGEEAIHHPLRLDVLRDMGRYTALINSVPTTGFGRTFEWSANRLSHNASWSAYLESELGLERRLEILKRHRMLAPLALRKLRELLLAIGRKRKAPTLNHGDMRLKNVIVDDAGKIVALIDWEECCSQIAPYWDVSLALHDLSVDAKQAFLDGYGLSPKEVIAMAPSLRALNIINYAPAVERAAGDAAALDQFRVRLSGALDLYAL